MVSAAIKNGFIQYGKGVYKPLLQHLVYMRCVFCYWARRPPCLESGRVIGDSGISSGGGFLKDLFGFLDV